MVPTYNGWEDTPEDEREALDLWEAVDQLPPFTRRSRVSQVVVVDGREGV
jgi:hypothetical protein